ncbi:MAG: 4-hydroxyacetophenone monooxygenase, partial [Micromonosporaceae bacterium]
GFQVTEPPLAQRIAGRGGHSLAEEWRAGMHAYLGLTVHGFPNLFLLLGPNTGLGHNSVVFMLECQFRYLLGALRHLDRRGSVALEPRRSAQDGYLAAVERRMAGTVWLQGGCRSWYLDRNGRNSTLWPGFTISYWRRLRRFDPRAYHEVGRGPEVGDGQAVASS